jgi:hypothetical protein
MAVPRGEGLSEDVSAECRFYLLHLSRLESAGRGQEAGRNLFVGWSDPVVFWPQAVGQKWGRSSPLRCFARGQIDRRGMRKRFSVGDLADRQGDGEGDG